VCERPNDGIAVIDRTSSFGLADEEEGSELVAACFDHRRRASSEACGIHQTKDRMRKFMRQTERHSELPRDA